MKIKTLIPNLCWYSTAVTQQVINEESHFSHLYISTWMHHTYVSCNSKNTKIFVDKTLKYRWVLMAGSFLDPKYPDSLSSDTNLLSNLFSLLAFLWAKSDEKHTDRPNTSRYVDSILEMNLMKRWRTHRYALISVAVETLPASSKTDQWCLRYSRRSILGTDFILWKSDTGRQRWNSGETDGETINKKKNQKYLNPRL